jgi:methylglutamate dehydrogenase subunit D
MPDTTPKVTRRSALDGHRHVGDFGTIKGGVPGIVIQERRALSIVHVDAWTDQVKACGKAIEKACGTAPAAEPVKAVEKNDTAVLWVGPNRWLIVEPESRDLFATVSADVSVDLATLTDQSHSRVCWRITGPNMRDLLAKGSTIDFDRSQFVPGDCVGTLLSHFTTVLHCRGDDTVDIYAARSFAVDMDHWLHASSLEYGLRVLEPI